MGRGIGHVFAYAGYQVDIIDFKPGARDLSGAVMGEIAASSATRRPRRRWREWTCFSKA
jgi:3-hydroxyacyl-CoA dehydrogenase